jgi:hypothetical protein
MEADETILHHCQNRFLILLAFAPHVAMGEANYDAAAEMQQEAAGW